ncbi:hypothetical protein D9758_016563 [Tetrapyrgos nigripes]|uniref:Major facilitator superfamily (MFS) profile domain-containing protein n=1 Tax=Tetrapyrgos nigripes TaxID=182062 RepID=A0A8H5FCS3_9AGAR|nr:hypothetical protein D9758_016563 [Tetrapyrgos nigripes]
MNIPSAIVMITSSFPIAAERGWAYAIYGAFGAVGNCQLSWRWVFYLLAILVIPFSVLSWFILPGASAKKTQNKSLDWPGVASLTVGLILFVFAISEGSASGWKSARVIAPLVISVFTFAGFLVIERIVKDLALPPHT